MGGHICDRFKLRISISAYITKLMNILKENKAVLYNETQL